MQILSKWCHNGVEGMTVFGDTFCSKAHKALSKLTNYDEAKFSSCHIPFTTNILHHVSSYYFLSHKKLFQAGNFNVNVRQDLLYFSIWGIYSKTYQNHNLWQVETAKTLCISSRRLVWWNVIHSTKLSVVVLALKTKGQTILNAPRTYAKAWFQTRHIVWKKVRSNTSLTVFEKNTCFKI